MILLSLTFCIKFCNCLNDRVISVWFTFSGGGVIGIDVDSPEGIFVGIVVWMVVLVLSIVPSVVAVF